MRKQITAVENCRVSPVARGVVFLMLLLVMVGCNGPTAATAPAIVLISIDDLRADHLGCYGYKRNTSPHIDSLAQEGLIFSKCYIHEPWTLPSHISLLTSLYPITHGVDKSHLLDPAIVTLAESLQAQGYTTVGSVSGGVWMHPRYGFGRGFDIYNLNPDVRAEDQNAFVKEMLEKYRGKQLFLFIHYFDVHSDIDKLPYEAPPPYNTLFSRDYCGGFKGGTGTDFSSKQLAYINENQIALAQDDIECIISLYDNGIAYADKCVGDLIALLKQENRFDNTLIVITADHGEEFQEHGYLLHDNPYYYEEIVHVPLILKLPKTQRNFPGNKRGEIVNDLVESIDIMPTILDIAGIDGPRVQGMSLLKLIDGDGNGKECVFGLGSSGNLMIRTERWKLVNDRGFQEDRFKLFDLHNDPMERVNLSGTGLAIEARLKESLKRKVEQSHTLKKSLIEKGATEQESEKDNDTVTLTPEEKERLKALGYVK